MIYLRKANLDDVDQINRVIQDAKGLLAMDQIPQWQGSYPQKRDLLLDARRGMTYVLIYNWKIVGTATMLTTADPNYQKIYQGEWQPSDGEYVTLHRIAIQSDLSGNHLGEFLFSNLISESYRLGYKEIRVDTHRQNLRMRHILGQNNFEYTGVVYMDDNPNEPRNAYQLFLEK